LANLSGDKRAEYVQEMFTRIAFRYDLMNRIMTAGQDVYWRKWVTRICVFPLPIQWHGRIGLIQVLNH